MKKHPRKAVLRGRGSWSERVYVAQWIGDERGYLWVGTLDDGFERYVAALSMGQAKQLYRLLDAHVGNSGGPE